jgi:hypothetical protein
MKDIKDMNLAEAITALRDVDVITRGYQCNYEAIEELADRIHNLTRWIPVSERMPTEEDFGNDVFRVWVNGTDERACFDCGKLLVWENDSYNAGWCEYDKGNWKRDFTHWQHITPPEGV